MVPSAGVQDSGRTKADTCRDLLQANMIQSTVYGSTEYAWSIIQPEVKVHGRHVLQVSCRPSYQPLGRISGL